MTQDHGEQRPLPRDLPPRPAQERRPGGRRRAPEPDEQGAPPAPRATRTGRYAVPPSPSSPDGGTGRHAVPGAGPTTGPTATGRHSRPPADPAARGDWFEADAARQPDGPPTGASGRGTRPTPTAKPVPRRTPSQRFALPGAEEPAPEPPPPARRVQPAVPPPVPALDGPAHDGPARPNPDAEATDLAPALDATSPPRPRRAVPAAGPVQRPPAPSPDPSAANVRPRRSRAAAVPQPPPPGVRDEAAPRARRAAPEAPDGPPAASPRAAVPPTEVVAPPVPAGPPASPATGPAKAVPRPAPRRRPEPADAETDVLPRVVGPDSEPTDVLPRVVDDPPAPEPAETAEASADGADGHDGEGAEAAAPTRGDRIRAAVRTAGELMITAGLVVLLFVVYEVYVTDWLSAGKQHDATNALDERWKSGQDPLLTGGERGEHYNLAEGQGFAKIYIPKFGPDFAYTVLEGTTDQILESGPGHYKGTALPGQPGNFAVAGHRVGKGAPFNDLDQLESCDSLVVETSSSWYVYRVLPLGGEVENWTRNADSKGNQPRCDQVSPLRTKDQDGGPYARVPGQEIVTPDRGEVIAPVPNNSAAAVPKTQQIPLITLTTCHPRFSAKQRLIVHGRLVREWKKDQGKPGQLPPELKEG
ncbi:class E sortase [Streptoalloteichus hindustanus]|uniref:LPXTG-site transpeptidase (Sortase) family protein n=1 Tax=Streptoalloteichus hindustanus TaxID=2017 RepID=A0A1M4V5V0_STRHI|nr:class E sortase [Streptoalloteichus hindustanus]SHE64300.1 LPXTG-site transpeptidase (sortase) family protein [Streptoalloteichus hindustanus]